MRSIRNIKVFGRIFGVWDGYFGTGGFLRKDWIYFGLEFLSHEQRRISQPDLPPEPARSNVARLSDHRKPQVTADLQPRPTALSVPETLAARRRAR